MKINEIINEGVWDKLKTTGQQVRQGVSTVGQGIKQGVGTVANKVGQTYQQTRQAQQQRFAQAAASQNLTPGQLRTKNVSSFAGDLAKTIGAASTGQSYFTKANPTVPQKTIPVGTTLETGLGTFKMSAQGWTTDTNQPVKDPNIINKLNAIYYQNTDDSVAGTTDKPASTTSPSGLLGPGGKPIQYDAQGNAIVS